MSNEWWTLGEAADTLQTAVDIVQVDKKFSEIVTALERLMVIEENSITRSGAGVVLQVILSFSFLTFRGL